MKRTMSDFPQEERPERLRRLQKGGYPYWPKQAFPLTDAETLDAPVTRLTQQMLSQCERVLVTASNQVNQAALKIALRQFEDRVQVILREEGSNQVGDLRALSKQAHDDVNLVIACGDLVFQEGDVEDFIQTHQETNHWVRGSEPIKGPLTETLVDRTNTRISIMPGHELRRILSYPALCYPMALAMSHVRKNVHPIKPEFNIDDWPSYMAARDHYVDCD